MDTLDADRIYIRIADIKGEDVYKKFSRGSAYEIRIYGRNLEGESQCIHIPDFRPYAYIGYYAPSESMRSVMMYFLNNCVLRHIQNVPPAYGGDGKVTYERLSEAQFARQGRMVLGKQMKMGFDSDENNSVFWRMEFGSKRDQNEFQRRWRSAFPSCKNTYQLTVSRVLDDIEKEAAKMQPVFRNQEMQHVRLVRGKLQELSFPTDVAVSLFHSLMAPDILFTHDLQIQPSGWISYPKKCLKETPPELDGFSTCSKDVLVKVSELRAVSDNKFLNEFPVKMRIGSTDIETEGLYAMRTTLHMVDILRTFLPAFQKVRAEMLQQPEMLSLQRPEDYRDYFIQQCVRVFLHFTGKRLDPDLAKVMRSDFYLEEEGPGNHAVTEERLRLFLTHPVEYSWYQRLMDVYRDEKTLTEAQKVVAQSREKELREKLLSKHLMEASTISGEEYSEEVGEGILEARDLVENSDDDDDDGDDDSDSGSDEDDEHAARAKKRRKRKRDAAALDNDLGDDSAEAQTSEAISSSTRNELLAQFLQLYPLSFGGEAMSFQTYSNFKVADRDDSLWRLLLDGRIFQDLTRGAELLAYCVRMHFGLPKSDKIYDITTALAYPFADKSFARYSFLSAEHFRDPQTGGPLAKEKLPEKYWDSVIHWSANERELLLAWRDWYVDVADVDMHTGYNTTGFDIPFMYMRARKWGILNQFMKLSRNRQEVCSGRRPFLPRAQKEQLSSEERLRLEEPILEKKYTKIRLGEALQETIPQEGRSELDMLIFFKKNKNYPCYSLDYTTSMTITEDVQSMEVRGHLLWIKTKKFLGLSIDDFIHLQLKSTFVINNVGPKLKVVNLMDLNGQLWIVAGLPSEKERFNRLLPRSMFRSKGADHFNKFIRPLLKHYPDCLTEAEEPPQIVRHTEDRKPEEEEEEEEEVLLSEEEFAERQQQNARLVDLMQEIQQEKDRQGKSSGMRLTWGFAKDDMDYASMQKFAKSGHLDEFMLLVKYCIRDCELPILLFKNLGVWNSFSEISKLAQVSLNLTLVRGESIRLHSFITNMCRQRRVFMSDIFQPFNDDREKRTGKKLKNFEGAFVIPPLTRLYNDRDIIVCDFNSLYPSLILSYLLGHDSKALRIEVDLQGKVVGTWTACGLLRQMEKYRLRRGLFPQDEDVLKNKEEIGQPFRSEDEYLTHDKIDGLGQLWQLMRKKQDTGTFSDADRPDVMYFRSVDREDDSREYVLINQKFPVRKNVDPKEVDGPLTKRKKPVEKIVGYIYMFYCVDRHFMRRTIPAKYVEAVCGQSAAEVNLAERFKLPIIGAMCDNFLKGRKLAKDRMEVASEEGNKQAYDMYNAQQAAVKQMNNSVYGSTGNSNGGYFCDFDIASTVTSLGRLYILYSSSITSSSIFTKPGTRIYLNLHLHPSIPYRCVTVPIPTSLSEVGDLVNDLGANTRLVERYYRRILEEEPLLTQDREAYEMAKERYMGLFALEHTNGFLAYRDGVLKELIDNQNFTGRMKWMREICDRTGAMVWRTHTKEDIQKGKTESEALRKVQFVEFTENPTVYGDTDSVFFTPKLRARCIGEDGVTDLFHSLSEVDVLYIERALGTCVGSFVTQIAPPPMKLAYEKILSKPILANRKRYASDKIEDVMEKRVPLVMGLGICRKDTPDFIKSILIMQLNHLKANSPMYVIVDDIRTKIQMIMEDRAPLDQLTLTCSIKANYAKPDQVKQVKLAARMAEREPATAPKAGDRIRYLHIVPEGMHMIHDRYRIDPIKMGDRIETPEYVKEKGLSIDKYHYVVKILFSQMMQFFGLAIDLVYAYLDRMDEYNQVVLPHIAALDKLCRDEKGDLKAVFNKKKNDYCTELAKSLLGPILFPDYHRVVRTITAARQLAKAAGRPYIPPLFGAGAGQGASSAAAASLRANRPKPTKRSAKLFPVFQQTDDDREKKRRATGSNDYDVVDDDAETAGTKVRSPPATSGGLVPTNDLFKLKKSMNKIFDKTSGRKQKPASSTVVSNQKKLTMFFRGQEPPKLPAD